MIQVILLTKNAILMLNALCQPLKHVREMNLLQRVLWIAHLNQSSLILAYRTEIVSIFHQQRTISRVLELIVNQQALSLLTAQKAIPHPQAQR